MSKKANTYHHNNLRPALLDETAAMITEDGVASVTMRALGKRLGVSRGAPYRHFKGKSDLLLAVAATGFESLGERIQAIVTDSSRSLEEQLEQLGVVYIHFALENPAHYRLMYGKESLRRGELPVLKASGDALFALLRDMIDAFQQEIGNNRKDTKALVYVAWSAVHGLASLLIDEQIIVAVDIDVIIHQTMRTVINGIRV
ncbi:TetR/AcrR family transcriptional regulator [bacterium]|nr:TetR/AcrR family transcriptional regulator [bacterium]